MFDMSMNPLIIATQSATGMPAAAQIYAEVANAADMDLGYEVAFPFLTAGEGSNNQPAANP